MSGGGWSPRLRRVGRWLRSRARWCSGSGPCCRRRRWSPATRRTTRARTATPIDWVASVHALLPPNAVVVSWWSYSTPLWHHRWVLGERPDLTIIDERDVLDDGYRTMNNAIRANFGKRPVYVVLPEWERKNVTEAWEMSTVPTLPGFTRLLLVEGPAT